jgi:hypothetical protein
MPSVRRILILGLLLALAATSVAVAAPGRFKGKSKQGLAISLGPLHRDGTRIVRYQAKMSCSDGTTFTDGVISDQVTISRTGRFSDSWSDSRGAFSTSISGRIVGNKVSGRLRVQERFSDTPDASGFTPTDPKGSVRCDSGRVKWSAKA